MTPDLPELATVKASFEALTKGAASDHARSAGAARRFEAARAHLLGFEREARAFAAQIARNEQVAARRAERAAAKAEAAAARDEETRKAEILDALRRHRRDAALLEEARVLGLSLDGAEPTTKKAK